MVISLDQLYIRELCARKGAKPKPELRPPERRVMSLDELHREQRRSQQLPAPGQQPMDILMKLFPEFRQVVGKHRR